MIQYTTLNKLNESAYMQSLGYGLRIPVKTIYVGIMLDIIIPFTFGLITMGLKKLLGNELGYIPIHSNKKK